MAQGFDFDYSVTDEQKAHYNGLREQRGWSWATLAAQFESQTTDPASAALAAWARSQEDAPKSARAAKKGTERAAKAAPEKR